jgi:hypothetical protein
MTDRDKLIHDKICLDGVINTLNKLLTIDKREVIDDLYAERELIEDKLSGWQK